jgi:hypothetical protein
MPPLDCPFCSHENPAGAKFCNECGSPLHLAPCGDCGAVNNLTDTHCWRCGGLVLPPYPPVHREDLKREPGTRAPQATGFEEELAAPKQQSRELEEELVALEQEVRGLEPAHGRAETRAPGAEQASRGSSTSEPKAADPRPRQVEQAFRGPDIPEPRSLFVQADDAPRSRRRGFIAIAVVVALGSAIAVGAYLGDRDGASPEIAVFPGTSQTRADPATAPRVEPDVAAAPAALPAPDPKGVDAPIERRVADDIGEAPETAPASTAALQPTCPPAVAAMALCEWLVHANRD